MSEEPERARLMQGTRSGNGGGQPDWSRFGLSEEQQKESKDADTEPETTEHDDVFEHHGHSPEKNELYAEEQVGLNYSTANVS